MSILLEVCVDRAEGLAAAIEGGADRVELCSALDVGGLTPSRGMMAQAAEADIPVYAMIRPHAGSFVFDRAAREIMLADIDAARECGLAGVVLGASLPDGRLDVDLLSALADRARGMGTTLHRAFDLVPDPLAALEQAIELGFERILTSGLKTSAFDGAAAIATLVQHSGGRISIMAGSGIGPSNIVELLRSTGVREVHGSCRGAAVEADPVTARFGFAPPWSAHTSAEVVKEMRMRISSANERRRG
jgi:copper homeostasis protein